MGNKLNPELLKASSYIDGRWQAIDQSRTFPVFNPATHELIASLGSADVADANLATQAAANALPAWRKKSAKERGAILNKWFLLVHQHIDDLAHVLTAEQGKPLSESVAEIVYGASYIQWFAEEAKRIYGDVIPSPSADKKIIVVKQPIGVVSAITPWNFPCAMIARKAAPALAAGCTFVVKAAKETPLSALALAVLAEKAGVPAGVFNVLVTDNSRAIGEVLTTDPRIGKFSFTGSTAVGKTLLSQCASTVKKTTMELGGNAPFIVFNDADIDAAVEGALVSKFRNAGQTCVCTNRLLIQSSIYQAFAEKLVAKVRAYKQGPGTVDGVDIGPLINESAVADISQLVDSALSQGAEALVGGERVDVEGAYYPPTVLVNVTHDMDVVTNEIFGPVAPLIPFDTEEQAIAMANDTNVGLASYIYTRDIGRVWRVSDALEFGMVGINEGIISNEAAPFGGLKESGMGREGSKYGLDDYLEIKYLCMGGLTS